MEKRIPSPNLIANKNKEALQEIAYELISPRHPRYHSALESPLQSH